MNVKGFTERLHQALDHIDFPTRLDERIDTFAKLVKIQRFKAESILSGSVLPDPALLTRIAEELEVSEEWLVGKQAS